MSEKILAKHSMWQDILPVCTNSFSLEGLHSRALNELIRYAQIGSVSSSVCMTCSAEQNPPGLAFLLSTRRRHYYGKVRSPWKQEEV
jgi:hypothetical protein